MQLPDAVRRVAMLAPGKRMTVTVDGKSYALPIAPDPEPVAPPHPLEVVSQQLLARDAETRATLVAVAARADDTLNAVRDAVGAVAAGQDQITKSVNELAGTLHLPVKPIYDKSGKLIGAERVKKSGA